MDNSLWVKMHGGTTHFPIALVMASALFDCAGLIVPENSDNHRCLHRSCRLLGRRVAAQWL